VTLPQVVLDGINGQNWVCNARKPTLSGSRKKSPSQALSTDDSYIGPQLGVLQSSFENCMTSEISDFESSDKLQILQRWLPSWENLISGFNSVESHFSETKRNFQNSFANHLIMVQCNYHQ
jgi:hypothetical protein